MTRLDNAISGATEWVGPRSAELMIAGLLVGGAGATASAVAADGSLPDALAGWALLGGIALVILSLYSNTETQRCDVCGSNTGEFPTYCGVCGTPLSDDRESVVEAARAAAREEARKVRESEP